MSIFKSFVVFCFIFGLIFCIVVPNAFAHSGPGPPFLQVDGEYAKSNTYFSGSSDINVAQDLITKKHVVNTPITFTVDTSKLLVPPDIANASIFRWTFEENSKEHSIGKTVVHKFTQAKTYLVMLEVQAPGQPDFLVIDTVQINVLPNSTYQTPKPVISVATDAMQKDKPIIFKSNLSTVDPTTKIQKISWDLGDGTDSNDPQIEHLYKNFDNYISYAIVLRVTDAKGFYTDTGVLVDAIGGKIEFVDKNNKKNTIPIATTLSSVNVQTTQKSNNGLLYAGIFIVGIIFIAGVITVMQRKKA